MVGCVYTCISGAAQAKAGAARAKVAVGTLTVRKKPALPVDLYSIVPFGPWLQFCMGPREWRYRLRHGEETKLQTDEREYKERLKRRQDRRAAVKRREEEALKEKLAMVPRPSKVAAYARHTTARMEVVVYDAQAIADSSRAEVNRYRAMVAERRRLKRQERRIAKRIRTGKVQQVEKLRTAGVTAFQDLPDGAGKRPYANVKAAAAKAAAKGKRRRGALKSSEHSAVDALADLAVPIVFDVDDMAAAVKEWGGCEAVMMAWDKLDDTSDVDAEVTVRITATPPAALKKDAEGNVIQPTPEEAAERDAQKALFDKQVRDIAHNAAGGRA